MHTITWANKPYPVTLLDLSQYKIIKKSVMGESYVLCLARLNPQIDSQFTILDLHRNREWRLATDFVNLLLNGTVRSVCPCFP